MYTKGWKITYNIAATLWILGLWILTSISPVESQSCTSATGGFFKGWAAFYEHSTMSFNMTAADIDADNQAAIYVCGNGESDSNNTNDRGASNAYVFKVTRTGALSWQYRFYPSGFNYTFCNAIAWIGDKSNLALNQNGKPVVFVGYSDIVNSTMTSWTTGIRKCFIGQIFDNGTTLSSRIIMTYS